MKYGLSLLLMLISVSGFAIETKTKSSAPSAFKTAKCPFVIPSGERAECGYLTVQENRITNAPKQIKLFVTIIKSYSHQPKTDPIVVLAGGPGMAPSTLLAEGKWWGKSAPYRQDRDLILIDQRGTGLSKPRLDCGDLKPFWQTDQDFLQAIQTCHNHLIKQKIDLTAYNTRESAQDVIALMRDLHFKKWNILATSYGARLAMVVMQIDPQSIRSVVLNSVMPLQSVEHSPERAVNSRKVFERLFYDCGVNSFCRKHYPNLQDVYMQLVRSLPKKSAENHQVTASMVIDAIRQRLSNTQSISMLPQKIFELANLRSKGQLNKTTFTQIMGEQEPGEGKFQYGMQNSVICYDVGKALDHNNKRTAKTEKYFPFYISHEKKETIVCNIWGRGDVLTQFQNQTFRPIPTLIFTGEYDTLTPPVWSRQVARKLPNAKFFFFKGVGHDVISSSLCARYMSVAFFNRPDHKPEDVCVTALKPPTFDGYSAEEKTGALAKVKHFISHRIVHHES